MLYQLVPAAAPVAALGPLPAVVALQQPAGVLEGGAPNATATPGPSPLSEVYSEAAFAGNKNFSFLPGYDTVVTGEPGAEGFSVQLINSTTKQNISAWHDIPLALKRDSNGSATVYVLVEIPEGDQAKYEAMVSYKG